VSDNKTRFTTQFNPHIQLKKNKGYEIALVNLETYFFLNVTEENYRFIHSPDEGQTWFVIFVPEGSYDIEDINKVIQQKITQNGHSNQIRYRQIRTLQRQYSFSKMVTRWTFARRIQSAVF